MADDKRKPSDAAADAAASIAKKMVARPLTPDEAIAVVDGKAIAAQIIGITPEELTALAHGGFAMIESGRFKDAEQLFVGLVMLDRGEAIFHNALGIAYLRQDKLPEARRAFLDAVILSPKNAHFYLNLGEVLSRQGLLHEAAASLAEVEKNTPEDKRDKDQAVIRARLMLEAVAEYLKNPPQAEQAESEKPAAKKPAKKSGKGSKKKSKK